MLKGKKFDAFTLSKVSNLCSKVWNLCSKVSNIDFSQVSEQIHDELKTIRPVRLERPERAEALSPGQRPGYKGSQQVAL